jgi:hypothetical protein
MNRIVASTVCLAATLALQPSAALAEVTKAQCVDADTNAQSFRRDGRFTEARQALTVCSDPQCPALVRDDCTRQLDALTRDQPTVVFDAKDGSGVDVSAVRVTLDGKPVAERLDGTPLPVDRGEHVFTFVTDGKPAVTLTLVVKDAEKDRRVTVTIGEVKRPAEAAEAPKPRGETGTQRTLGLVAGGASVVALGVGTVFGILAASKWSAAKSACGGAGNCPSYSQAAGDHDAAASDGTISTVGVLAGAALLATGAALFFTAPHSTEAATTVGVGPGSAVLMGRF